jgi:UDP-N-acetylglucosamine 2-epimerase (non-hydrolysing)
MKALIIFGTRPEAIKLVPVIKALERYKEEIKVSICLTSQHKQMIESILELFSIQINYNLNLMKKNQSLFDIAAKGLRSIEKILIKEIPDYVIVQGDTSTAFIAALSAYYMKINIAHVEAGLRTKNKYSPFPEEINRKFIDHLSDLCFAPTELAAKNLIEENIPPDKIHITGNTVVDALLMVIKLIRDKEHEMKKELNKKYGICLDDRKLIIVTTHRRESFGADLNNICLAIKKLALNRNDIRIIFPVHLNPNVFYAVHNILGGIDNICLVKPLDYLSFIWLMSNCYFILTDSGGIQEEAPTLGKPVLVVRKASERSEGIELGVSKLVGVSSESIYAEAIKLIDDYECYKSMVSNSINPYGDGKAAERIVDILRGIKGL